MEAAKGIQATQAFCSLSREEIKALRKIRNKEKRQKKKENKLTEKCEKLPQKQQLSSEKSMVSQELTTSNNNDNTNNKTSKKKKSQSKITINLADHIKEEIKQENFPLKNTADANKQIFPKGKQREEPKPKKVGKLKKEIQLQSCIKCADFNYLDNKITANLEQHAQNFIRRIVELQERLYKKDPIKGVYRKRYIEGFHQIKKFLIIKKVKLLLIATNIKVQEEDDALHKLIKETLDLCNSKDIPYVFALKRSKIGKLTLKSTSVCCIAILDYSGAEDLHNLLFEEIQNCKEKFKTSKLASNCQS